MRIIHTYWMAPVSEVHVYEIPCYGARGLMLVIVHVTFLDFCFTYMRRVNKYVKHKRDYPKHLANRTWQVHKVHVTSVIYVFVMSGFCLLLLK